MADYELGLKIIAGEADRELGAGLIREAAELGLVARGACAACFWWRGSGWRKTRPKAVKWHELAARQGDSGSMFDLGSLCERGDAIAKDLKTAA